LKEKKEYKNTLIIVPTYNEVENIGSLLERLIIDVPGADILVVDDNSPDGTRNLVLKHAKTEPRVHLLDRKKKAGLAGAYIAGFSWAIDNGYQVIVQMDADFSHNPKTVPELLDGLSTHDVMVGSRYVPRGGVVGWPWYRHVISRCGNLYAKNVLGTHINDNTGGFVAWKREVLETIGYKNMRCKGYAFLVELKYRSSRAGFKVGELPIRFIDRRFGESKMSGQVFFEAALRVLQMKLISQR